VVARRRTSAIPVGFVLTAHPETIRCDRLKAPPHA